MLKFVSKTPSPVKSGHPWDQNKQKYGMYILDLNQNYDNVSPHKDSAPVMCSLFVCCVYY